VTFRPSALAYALCVVVGWLVCLAVALGRVEPLFVAVPLVLRLLRAPTPAATTIDAFELMTDVHSLNENEEFTLTIVARVAVPTGLVEIIPVLPPQVRAERRAVVLLPQADGGVRWELRLLCRHGGTLDLDTVFFRCWDSSNLWLAEDRRQKRRGVAVHSTPLTVRNVPAPRWATASYGRHISRIVGDGSDFADIRTFVTGDRMRRINWAASLRLRQLHVNQFHVERSADVVLLMDAFAHLGRRPESSLDHCLRAAAGLARTYLRQQDRVGLLALGGWLHWIRPAAGPRQFGNILRALTRVTVVTSDFRQSQPIVPDHLLPRHALIVALSPLVDARFAQVIVRLADQGRDTVLLAIRGDELSLPLLPRRARHPLAHGLWQLHREDQLQALREHGVRAVDWSPAQPIDAALAMLQAVPRRGIPWSA